MMGRPVPDDHGRSRALRRRAVNGYKILALDVDGTLLDRDSVLRPTTAAAVARAARAGIRPVLCTGRRYRRARPVAEQLGLDAPLVCNSGALVKDPAGHATLWRADFEAELLAEVLALFRRHDQPAVSFHDRDPDDFDFVTARFPTRRPLFDEYVALNQPHAEIDPAWLDRAGTDRHFHVCAVGERPAMEAFEAAILAALPGRVRTFVQKSPRYSGTMCEVIRPDASKWSAVLHLAERWGVDPSEVVAVGDDMNDKPMIEGAGLGVAMGHAPAEVRAAADLVTGDHDQDGVAALIDDVLLA
jgi:5-amino-6-(5-phospho-D-ribitylamino)uracil phosphatase